MPEVIINGRAYQVSQVSLSITVDECTDDVCCYGSSVGITMEWRLAFALLSAAPGPYDISIPGVGFGSGELLGCDLVGYDRDDYDGSARLRFERRPVLEEDRCMKASSPFSNVAQGIKKKAARARKQKKP